MSHFSSCCHWGLHSEKNIHFFLGFLSFWPVFGQVLRLSRPMKLRLAIRSPLRSHHFNWPAPTPQAARDPSPGSYGLLIGCGSPPSSGMTHFMLRLCRPCSASGKSNKSGIPRKRPEDSQVLPTFLLGGPRPLSQLASSLCLTSLSHQPLGRPVTPLPCPTTRSVPHYGGAPISLGSRLAWSW